MFSARAWTLNAENKKVSISSVTITDLISSFSAESVHAHAENKQEQQGTKNASRL